MQKDDPTEPKWRKKEGFGYVDISGRERPIESSGEKLEQSANRKPVGLLQRSRPGSKGNPDRSVLSHTFMKDESTLPKPMNLSNILSLSTSARSQGGNNTIDSSIHSLSIREYYRDSKLFECIRTGLVMVGRDRPEDPISYLGKYLVDQSVVHEGK